MSSANKQVRKEAELEKARREKEHREFKEAQELESLRRAFKRMNKAGNGKVSVEDLLQELDFLGHKVRREEAVLMIWEVDDDADGCIDWDEFRSLFYRIRDDQSGFEPRKLFNVIEFIMHDKNLNGSIDLDEAVTLLYARYGRECVDEHVKATFSNDDTEKNIKFSQYAKVQQMAAKSKNGSGLKPGATMVPHVKGMASVVDPGLAHLM